MPKFNDTTIYGNLTVTGTIVNSDILTTIAATATTGAAGTSAAVTVNRDGNLATLSFTVPKGDKGDPGTPGAAATVSVGTTTTGAAGTSASVTQTGTAQNRTFNFTIPKGDKGDPGADGLTTQISLNDTTYTQTGGTITLPGLVRSDGNVGDENYINLGTTSSGSFVNVYLGKKDGGGHAMLLSGEETLAEIYLPLDLHEGATVSDSKMPQGTSVVNKNYVNSQITNALDDVARISSWSAATGVLVLE